MNTLKSQVKSLNLTLRQALESCDLQTVYTFVNKRDCYHKDPRKSPTLEQTARQYSRVVWELLQKPKTNSKKTPIFVHEVLDRFDKKKYIDVCLLNPQYVAPKAGLKPYGCKRGVPPPKGFYNVNLKKHSRYYSMGFVPWSELIDTKVINDTNYSLERVVAEILWELTFYGWTEEKAKAKTAEIEEQIKIAEQEIKLGECVKLPPSKKGGFSIVIPDSVSQSLIDIANKND